MQHGWKSLSEKDYRNIHQWLRRHYGRATQCENKCGTATKIFDWALIKGKPYARNRKHFKMLCKKCHHKYDKISRFGPAHPMYGKTHSKEARRKMSIAHIGNTNMLGKKLSAVTRKRMSLVRKGVPKSEAHKKAISKALKGFAKTEAHKTAMRVAKRKL